MKLLWRIFATIGGVFVTVALVIAVVTTSFYGDAAKVDGVVVSLRYSKGSSAPVVAYTTPDGVERQYHSHIYSRPGYVVGERVTIAYDPTDPDDAALDSWTNRWLLPVIFGGIGSQFLVIGSIGLLLRARRRREVATLMRTGQRVEAEAFEVGQDTHIRVNRKHPYFIRLRWTDPATGTQHVFRSRRFWSDPTPLALGRTFPVYFDRGKPSRHVVDTATIQLHG